MSFRDKLIDKFELKTLFSGNLGIIAYVCSFCIFGTVHLCSFLKQICAYFVFLTAGLEGGVESDCMYDRMHAHGRCAVWMGTDSIHI